MPTLVQELFDGPLDIVGDVHGEIDALRALLGHLGYDELGRHPQGRHIVFLGDLTDRGPDSPGVVALVRKLVDDGRAQCVLGNHDLNLLLNHSKAENLWFYHEDFLHAGSVVPQQLADKRTRDEVVALFSCLPLALERRDLRVIHACWNDEMLSFARCASNVVSLYHDHADRIAHGIKSHGSLDSIDEGLRHQNCNPVKVLTSGPEERVEIPIEAGGRLRYERRVEWWHTYQGVLCVFGHYGIRDGNDRHTGATLCVDFGVGKRWTERVEGKSENFNWRLAALRVPEMDFVFDNGEVRKV